MIAAPPRAGATSAIVACHLRKQLRTVVGINWTDAYSTGAVAGPNRTNARAVINRAARDGKLAGVDAIGPRDRQQVAFCTYTGEPTLVCRAERRLPNSRMISNQLDAA